MTAADSGSPRVTSRLTKAQQRLSPQTPRELHLVSLGILEIDHRNQHQQVLVPGSQLVAEMWEVSVLKVLTQEHAQPCQARPAGLLLTMHK